MSGEEGVVLMSYSLSQKVQSSCYSKITFVLVASKRNRSDYILTAHRGVVHFYNHPILYPSLFFYCGISGGPSGIALNGGVTSKRAHEILQ